MPCPECIIIRSECIDRRTIPVFDNKRKASRRASQLDDRQLPSALVKANDQLAAGNRLWLLRLFDCSVAFGPYIVDFVWGPAVEPLVSPMHPEPRSVRGQFVSHRHLVQRNRDLPQPLVFERKEETLDDRRGPKASRGCVTRIDPFSIAPRLVTSAVKLPPLILNEVLGCAITFHQAAEEGPHVNRLRFL